jgi:hypothetical protein
VIGVESRQIQGVVQKRSVNRNPERISGQYARNQSVERNTVGGSYLRQVQCVSCEHCSNLLPHQIRPILQQLTITGV